MGTRKQNVAPIMKRKELTSNTSMLNNSFLLKSFLFTFTVVIFGRQLIDFQNNVGNKCIRFAVVVPVVMKDYIKFTSMLKSWKEVCSVKHNNIDLVALVNVPTDSQKLGEIVDSMKMILKKNRVSSCFRSLHAVSANLTPQEDVYPAGPSFMFYNFIFDKVSTPFGSRYDAFFWMEHDVTPVVSNWLDKLYAEAEHPRDFVIKGSLSRGPQVDNFVAHPFHRSWIQHINGNSIYGLNDDLKFLAKKAMEQYPPTNRGNPWDTAIWLILNKWVQTGSIEDWRLYQHFAHKYLYSNFIQSYVGASTAADAKIIAAQGSIFVHGNTDSVGYQQRHGAN